MMMGVDQPWQDHMVARLKEPRRCRRLTAFRYQLDDPAVTDDDAARRAIGEDGQRVLDPDRLRFVHGLRLPRKIKVRPKSVATPALKDQPIA
jgi:hypothetical protein